MCLHNTNHITRVLAGSAQAGFAWARLEVHCIMQSIRISKNGTGCFIGWCSRRVAHNDGSLTSHKKSVEGNSGVEK